MSKGKGKQSANQKKKPDRSTEIVEMPMYFARELIKQIVYNPQNSSSRKTYSYSLYTKENIIKWLQSPQSNEKSLRDASNYMYLSSMHYQRLIKYYAGIHMGYYVISPLGFEGKATVKREAFLKQYYKVAKALELMDIPSMLQKAICIALRDGAYYGVRWADKSSSFYQEVDADYCQITHVSNGGFLFSVDMSKLQGKLDSYPPEFTQMYSNYLKTGAKWQEVPAEISACVKADDTIVGYTTPPFASVMPSLYTLANVESLQETADELKNYKMISGKVPVDEDGVPTIGWTLFEKYYSHLKNALGENVGLAITPFELDTFSFEQKTGVSDVDNVGKAVANFWSTAGTSGLLHGIPNDTCGVTKLSLKNDESYINGIVKQFEKVINRYLKVAFSGNIKFKITFLPVTIFNKDDERKAYKEAASFGLGKSYYAASMGIPQTDIAALSFLEDEVVGFKDLTPMQSSYNASAESANAGRPKSSEEDLSKEGEATRDNDTNANR